LPSTPFPAVLASPVCRVEVTVPCVAGVLPATGGTPEVTRLDNTERAVRRFVDRLGAPDGLAVAL
jgi:hypothetical protein